MPFTADEKLEATNKIACLLFEDYTKEVILSMFPHYAEIFDEVYFPAIDIVREMARRSSWK